jgi:hypothetical protein
MNGPFVLVLSLVGVMAGDATHGSLCTHQLPSTYSGDAVDEFTAGVREYLRVRDLAVRGLPQEGPAEPGQMLAVRKALRRAIQDARPDARQGDLFTERAAAAFRHIVALTAAAHRVDTRAVVRAVNAERTVGAKPPAVNHRYDWRLGAWMWPALLQALPQLPPDLQYRIVDDDLVLIDVGASLVVDILEDAMVVGED